MASNAKRGATISAIAALTITLIYCIVIMMRRFVRSTDQIPYVMDGNLNRSFFHYVNTIPSRQILIVAGPRRSGKSRALAIFSRQLMLSGRLVLSIDASLFNSPDSVVSQISASIYSGFLSMRPYISADSSKVLSSYRKKVQKSQKLPYGVDTSFTYPYASLVESLGEADKPSELSSAKLIKFFGTLDSFHDALNAVVIISKADTIIRNSTLFDLFCAATSRRNQYRQFIPIVMEVEDSLLLLTKGMLSKSGLYKVVSTHELNATSQDFLVKSHVFTKTEARKAFGHFGGHGGSLSSVFEDLKFNEKVERAIEEVQETTNRNIDALYPRAARDRAFVKLLCRSDGRVRVPNVNNLDVLKPLFSSGYLTIDGSLQVRADRGVLRAICG